MRFSSFAVLVLAACIASTAQAQDPVTQVRSVMTEMDRAAAELDADRFMGFFWRSPDLTITFDGMSLQGWDTILTEQRKWWADKNAGIKFAEAQKPMVVAQGPNVVTSVQWMSVGKADLKQKPSRLVITSVWKKLPAGWRIVLAHESLSADVPE